MKRLLLKSIQACINTYGGEYGKVKKVFKRIKKFNVENVQGHFGYSENELWVVFRGSDEIDDWIYNFSSKKITPFVNKKIKVHEGFYKCWEKVKDLIFKEIKKHENVIVTGHSLGGALATICSEELMEHFDINLKSIPMASPRAGNKAFIQCYDLKVKKSYRVVNSCDMVTKVPTHWMGYRHVNKLIKIGKIPKWRFFTNWIGRASDHMPQKYLKAIQKL